MGFSNLFRYTAMCIVIAISIAPLSVALEGGSPPSCKRFKLSAADLQWGERQIQRMLVDRPAMAPVVKSGDKIWNWVRRQYAGEFTGMRYSWDSDKSWLQLVVASNSPQDRSIAVTDVAPNGAALSADQMWSGLIFELFNIRSHPENKRLWEQVQHHQIDKETYVRNKARLEYNALREQFRFFKKVWLPRMRKLDLPTKDVYWGSVAGAADFDAWFARQAKQFPEYLEHYRTQYDRVAASDCH